VTPCPPELQCEEVISRSSIVQGRVFFGDGNGEGRDTTSSGQRHPLTATHTSVGFVPVGLVAGIRRGDHRADHGPDLLLAVHARRLVLDEHGQHLRAIGDRGARMEQGRILRELR
jgi:hypothetical protein